MTQRLVDIMVAKASTISLNQYFVPAFPNLPGRKRFN